MPETDILPTADLNELPMCVAKIRKCLGLVHLKRTPTSSDLDSQKWPQYMLEIDLNVHYGENYVLDCNSIKDNGWTVSYSLSQTRLAQLSDHILEINPKSPSRGQPIYIYSPISELIKKWKHTLESLISVATERDRMLRQRITEEAIKSVEEASYESGVFRNKPLNKERLMWEVVCNSCEKAKPLFA